jgi:hypothetical protein
MVSLCYKVYYSLFIPILFYWRHKLLKPDYHIDIDWMHKISYRLDLFKSSSTSGKTFVCRCPYCGDSQRSKKKARFYFYSKKGSLNFDCKNCGEHGSFWTFMREKFADSFNEYKKDQLLKRLDTSNKRSISTQNKDGINLLPKEESITREHLKIDLDGCISLADLPDTHIAVKYMIGRSFDRKEINKLFYSPDFKITAASINPEPMSPNFPSEPRIVIPFYNKNKEIEMIQGRSLDPNSNLRYISIKAHEDIDKIYGRDFVNPNETTYCVEGPFDSLFVTNCYATCDSGLERSGADVLIYDNEPMNKQIVEIMSRAIENKRQIVIWPTNDNGKTDINDMIKMGINKKDLMKIIRSRTYSGLRAKLEFTKWKRV